MKNVDIHQIKYLYFEKQLTLKQVGARMGVSATTVGAKLKAAGYSLRSRSKGRSSRWTDADVSEMERLYSEEKLSLKAVAERFNCSSVTIGDVLKKRGNLRLRNYKESREVRTRREEMERRKGRTGTREDGGNAERTGTQSSNLQTAEVSPQPERKAGQGLHKFPSGCRDLPVPSAPLPGHPKTYTPPKRLGKVFDPIPLLPPEAVTPENILKMRTEDDLTVDDIAAICSLSRVDVYKILMENGGR